MVRAREGYIAPEATPPVLHTTVSTGVRFAPAIAEVLDHPIENPAVPMWVTAKAGASSGRDADVIVTADMDAAAVGEPDAEIELGAVAVNAAGTVVRAQRERFQPSAARSGADGAPLRVSRAMTISLPPGHYQLRVAAGNTGSTRAGSVLYDLDIPQPR